MVGLDPKAIKALKEVILGMRNNGATILISTHMLDMVKDLWDIMFIMEKGEIIGTYTKEDTKDRNIDEIFFGATEGEA